MIKDSKLSIEDQFGIVQLAFELRWSWTPEQKKEFKKMYLREYVRRRRQEDPIWYEKRKRQNRERKAVRLLNSRKAQPR